MTQQRTHDLMKVLEKLFKKSDGRLRRHLTTVRLTQSLSTIF